MPSSDVSVMELVAKTMGRLALVSGSKASEYVTFEVKRAFEWLSGDRVEVNNAVLFLWYYFQLLSQQEKPIIKLSIWFLFLN